MQQSVYITQATGPNRHRRYRGCHKNQPKRKYRLSVMAFGQYSHEDTMNGMAFDIVWIGDREVCVWFGDWADSWKRSWSNEPGQCQVGTMYLY